jgi:hypothetical protein
MKVCYRRPPLFADKSSGCPPRSARTRSIAYTEVRWHALSNSAGRTQPAHELILETNPASDGACASR